MSVRAEATPNPNALKFTTDKLIFEGTNSISVMPGDKSEHAVLNELMELEGVDNVFGYQNFITVNKKFDAEWDNLAEEVTKVIEKHGY
ncbi:NifU N-terminal domain-containing protein [Oceanobacillus manasiensis]|uniref:NifU N-terminal domain-containing protein n=1 Tax=Oceanobacillus manasiensis TaxID=586413 RepID=UPI0005A6B66E|nr:NifU N-terminal domain-containing protein [Oceanobacillus manasiensis]